MKIWNMQQSGKKKSYNNMDDFGDGKKSQKLIHDANDSKR